MYELEVIKSLLKNNIFVIALECAVTLLITWGIAAALRHMKRKHGQKDIHRKFLYNMAIAVVWIIGCTTAMAYVPKLSKLTQTLLAGSGIVAVVVGLAAQDSFGNLLSGLFISVFKPFNIGDRVKLVNSGITGYIEDITLRHTIIRTFINSRVIIPNSTINSELIENSNFTTTVSSSFVDVMVSYESDIRLAMRIMASVIGSHDLYLDQRTPEEIAAGVPKVQVLVRELADSGVCLRASMWTKTVSENFQACSDVRLMLMDAFRKIGIEIPYNKIVVIEQEKKQAGGSSQPDGSA